MDFYLPVFALTWRWDLAVFLCKHQLAGNAGPMRGTYHLQPGNIPPQSGATAAWVCGKDTSLIPYQAQRDSK